VEGRRGEAEHLSPPGSSCMEERKEPHGSRDSTEEESMSLSPNLPSPPVILPHQAAQQQAHRTTNFFIDNILRPDFGCRKEPSYRDRSQTPGREHVNPHGARPPLPPHTGSLCLDSNCSSDSPSSSPSSSSSSSSSSSTSSSPSSKQKSSKPGEAAGTGTGRYADIPSSIMVVSGSNGGATPTKESQPMLWPAWVYCTRYSDRPSSGKALIVPELPLVGVGGGGGGGSRARELAGLTASSSSTKLLQSYA